MMDISKEKIFNAAEYLDTKESIAIFLEEAFKSGCPEKIAKAIEVVALAKGMTQISKKCGIARDVLYRAVINEEHPSMQTLTPVVKSLGVKVKLPQPKPAPDVIRPETVDEPDQLSLLGSRLWMRFFNGWSRTSTT